MKRLTAILVAGIFLLAPLSVSAMEMMDDSSMKDVTGQAGVDIAIDDVVLFQDIGYTKYTDPQENDELGGASVMISGRTTLQEINAIAPDDGTHDVLGDREATFDYAVSDQGYQILNQDGTNAIEGGYTIDAWAPSPLTIDVGAVELIAAARAGNDDLTASPGQGVVIGLPTVEIHTSADTYDVGVVDSADTSMANNQTLIRIENGESTTAVLDGKLEIAPH